LAQQSPSWILVTIMAAVIALLVMVLALRDAWAENKTYTGPVTVIDGDTVEVAAQRVRIWAIDAPEQRWPSGKAATSFLRSVVEGETVTCFTWETDRYSRRVGQCVYENTYLGDMMIAEGWALFVKSRDPYDMSDRALKQKEAQELCLGIWSGDMCSQSLHQAQSERSAP